MINKKQILLDTYNYLYSIFPNAKCELNYSKDYELAIAVLLSAQTSDKMVNLVSEKLFKKYPNIEDYLSATYEDIYSIIKPLGLSKSKAKNILSFFKTLHEKYYDKLPYEMDDLTSLSGIGNKSARVIRIEIFHIEDFPADTHILRILSRLKIIKEKDPDLASQTVKKNIDSKYWNKFHHLLIFFGRYKCKAINPNCTDCALKKYCQYYQQLK
ncbi:MAG: endonuclease III domain-containing protein [Bacilli bacterium]